MECFPKCSKGTRNRTREKETQGDYCDGENFKIEQCDDTNNPGRISSNIRVFQID